MPNKEDILWFKTTFGQEIDKQIVNSPFTVDLFTAIACQETGYIWASLRKKGLTKEQILGLCVGDTIDGGGGRSAFPTSRDALESYGKDGTKAFRVARKALVDMAKYGFGYSSVAKNEDKFCHGFGIFQYDIQFFKEDPEWFLQEKWKSIEECVKKVIAELKRDLKKLDLSDSGNLSDEDMIHLGICYNTGHFNPSRGYKQGYFSEGKYYGELLAEFLELSQSVKVSPTKQNDKPKVKEKVKTNQDVVKAETPWTYYPHWVWESGGLEPMSNLPENSIIACHHRWDNDTIKQVLDMDGKNFKISWYTETNLHEDNDMVRPRNTPVRVRIEEAVEHQKWLLKQGYSEDRFTNYFELDAARDKFEGNYSDDGNSKEDCYADAALVKEYGFTYLGKSPTYSFVKDLQRIHGKNFVPRVVYEDVRNNESYREDAINLANDGMIVTVVVHANIGGSRSSHDQVVSVAEDYFSKDGMMVEVWRGLPSSDDRGFEKIKDFPKNSVSNVDETNNTPEPEPEIAEETEYKSIRLSSTGPYVRLWQTFLIGQKCYSGVVSENFDKKTKDATAEFQRRVGEKPDGWAGPVTQKRASYLGWNPYPKTPPVIKPEPKEPSEPVDTTDEDQEENFPPYPDNLKPMTSTADRMKLFGEFKYKAKPIKDNPENVEILGAWQSDNLVKVKIPQLKKALGKDAPDFIIFHKLGAYQLSELWKEWEKLGLLDRVKSYDDSYVPRFIRGSQTTLSNHAFGSAFDINADLNPLGSDPLEVGEEGSVKELVPSANKWGFFWGGHFGGRPDGMHFEIAKIIPKK
jgi:peptidoglycan hydrolase-like protein with peptidoglycan-binding domain